MHGFQHLKRVWIFILAIGLLGFAAAPAHAGEEPPLDLLSLGLFGPESLDPELNIDAVSRTSDGLTSSGIVTRDVRRNTTALVQTDLSTDATGIISGIVEITIIRDGEVIDVVEVPAVGRQRSAFRADIHVTQTSEADRRGGIVEDNFEARIRSVIALRALLYGTNHDLLLYGFAMRLHQAFIEDITGIIAGSEDYEGCGEVYARELHHARSFLTVAPLVYAFAEVYALQNTIVGEILGRRLHAEGVIFSDTLDVLLGARMVAAYVFANYLANQPGRFALRGAHDYFRFAMAGYLILSAAQASLPGVTAEDVLNRTLPRGFLLHSAAFHYLILISYDPAVLREIMQEGEESF